MSQSPSNFWNGSFTLKKSIGTVKFVPVADMSARDWRWLEFDNTRLVAQNRIARMVMSGRLKGFFQVMLTEKAAKNEYFWPADEVMLQQYGSDNYEFFGNEPEVLTDNAALEALNRLRAGMVLLPIWMVAAIIQVIFRVSESEENKEELSKIEQEFLAELRDEDMQLLLSILMMWELSLEEAEATLDDMPESDEADEVRDWIDDRVAEIEAARNAG